MDKYFLQITEREFFAKQREKDRAEKTDEDLLQSYEFVKIEKILDESTRKNELLQVNFQYAEPIDDNTNQCLITKRQYPNAKLMTNYSMHRVSTAYSEMVITMLPDISKTLEVNFFKVEDDYWFSQIKIRHRLIIKVGFTPSRENSTEDKIAYFKADGFYGFLKFIEYWIDYAVKDFSQILQPLQEIIEYLKPIIKVSPDIMEYYADNIDINLTKFTAYEKISGLSYKKLDALLQKAGFKFVGQFIKRRNPGLLQKDEKIDRYVKR